MPIYPFAPTCLGFESWKDFIGWPHNLQNRIPCGRPADAWVAVKCSVTLDFLVTLWPDHLPWPADGSLPHWALPWIERCEPTMSAGNSDKAHRGDFVQFRGEANKLNHAGTKAPDTRISCGRHTSLFHRNRNFHIPFIQSGSAAQQHEQALEITASNPPADGRDVGRPGRARAPAAAA